jgi:hydroxymethylpyrimidine pyrophosphatase-like HAD family hydrolase
MKTKKKGVIFSDVDGTLCFHAHTHGIKELYRNSNGTVLVLDPLTLKEFLTYDVSALNKAFIDIETCRLAGILKEQYEFVLVTGARPKTVLSRRKYLGFADAVIFENGGRIFDNNYESDKDWFDGLKKQRQYLKSTIERLQKDGWVLDITGRTSAISIRKIDNPHKTNDDFNFMANEFPLPDALKRSINMENLQIILRNAGKENAVRFWLEKKGYKQADTIGIGDDINDLDFLKYTEKKFVLLNSYPLVLETAKREKWHISQSPNFDGINEILKYILSISH